MQFIIKIEDFVIDEMFVQNVMKKALTKIKKDESIYKRVFDYIYYRISRYIFFLCIFFYKKYTIDEITLFENKEKKYESTGMNTLIISDTGFNIYRTHIPYENIISFCCIDNYFCLDVYAKYDKKTLCLDKTVSIVVLKTKSAQKIMKNIKQNMYYHIKYNKLNESVMKYYYNKEE